MSSANIVDFIAEKIFSFSSKMRDDSFQHNSTSYLMSSDNNIAHLWDPLKAVTVLKENRVDFEDGNQFYTNVLFNQVLGILNSNHNLKFPEHCERPECLFPRTKNGLFSPHLLNLISNLNSYHFKNTLAEMSLLPYNSIFGNMSSVNDPFEMLSSKAASEKKNNCSLPVNQSLKQNSEAESSTKKNCLPVSEFTMSVNISQLPTKTESSDKCNFSANVKLNLKLANRKTKQMNKRSRKRRRRQQKAQHSVGNSHSSRVSFVAKSPDLGCKISFQQKMHIPSQVSSFVVPVESNSEDDSEWDTYDEIDHCNPKNSTSDSEIDCEAHLSSSPVKSKNAESKFSVPNVKMTSSIVSFLVPVSDSSDDDDSEWDSCESGNFTEAPEFEYSGLFLTNLFSSQTVSSNNGSKLTQMTEDETEERLQLKQVLLEANKKWDNLSEQNDVKMKTMSKVTFASDKDLVEVFPVEIYERKGEWEMYATERMRFKRKIDELEKVLSPCLHPDHRTKVLKKLMEHEL